MPKQSSKSTKKETAANNKTKKTYKPRAHPLDPFVYTDEVPVTTYVSPLSTDHPFFCTESRVEAAQKLERKIRNHCDDHNTPLRGKAKERTALGECAEDVFDTYMSATMPSNLYVRKEEYTPYSTRESDSHISHIVYEFNYPHFPSFSKPSWTKYNTTVDVSDLASQFEELGGIIPEYFRQAEYRCVADKLFVSLNTYTEVYYVYMTSIVQKKIASSTSACGFAWINSI